VLLNIQNIEYKVRTSYWHDALIKL